MHGTAKAAPKFTPGQLVRVVKANPLNGEGQFFADGHIGVIVEEDLRDDNGDWLVDFNNQGNSFVDTTGSMPGQWYVLGFTLEAI